MKRQLNILTVFVFLALIACNNSSTTENNSETTTADVATTVPEGPEITVTLNSNDQMRFDLKEIKVREEQAVTLILHHTGTTSVKMMGHNFVLLKQGTDLSDFARKAAAATDTDYIPQSEAGNIIVHTRMIGGGESDTITFTAPAKGTYEFLCTFPGHYGVMRGKFIVI